MQQDSQLVSGFIPLFMKSYGWQLQNENEKWKENQRLIGIRAPFEGKTWTGGEGTLVGWSKFKDYYSESPKSRTIQSRSPHEVPAGVEQCNRRSRHTPGHQRCQTTDDSQTSSKTSLQGGAGWTKERTSYRRSHRGSALSGLVLVSLNFFLSRSVGHHKACDVLNWYF